MDRLKEEEQERQRLLAIEEAKKITEQMIEGKKFMGEMDEELYKRE